jgi:uncharacterized protein with HEPN domain
MNSAETFIENMDFEQFEKDDKTSSAVLRKLEVIGEASKGVPEKIRKKYPDIPWKSMAGMRDKIVHLYFGVNFKRIWLVVKEDIPRLKPLIEKVLAEFK